MNAWYRQPFILFAASFLGAARVGLEGGLALGLAIAALVPIAALLGDRREALRPIVAGCAAAAIALAAAELRAPARHPLSEAIGESRLPALVEATVTAGPDRFPDGASVDLRISAVDGQPLAAPAKVRVFVPDERGPAPLPGDRVELFGELERYAPRRFPLVRSRRERMESRGYVARFLPREPARVVGRARDPGLWIARHLATSRLAFEARLARRLAAPNAAIARAMLVGNRAFLDERLTETFRATGTAHLLAISGLHFGVLAALLWGALGALVSPSSWLLLRYGRRRVCAGGVLFALLAYLLWIGAPVSAVRAFVAAACVAGAVLLLRRVCPFHALACAAVVLAASRPLVVTELGFQLSFAATLGIVVFVTRSGRDVLAPEDPLADEFSERRQRRWRERARRLGLFVGVSASATLATWPVLLVHLGEVAPCGLWTNLLAVPVVTVLVFPALIVGAVVSLVAPEVGGFVMTLATDAMLLGAEGLGVVAELPLSTWRPGAPEAWVGWGAAGLVAWVLAARRREIVCAGVLGLVVTVAALEWRARQPVEALEVHAIPVGQGDATLVRFPDGSNLLVDAGGAARGRDPGRHVVVPYLRRLGIRRLDAVIVTHGDVDHVGGVAAVVELVETGELVFDAEDQAPALGRLRRAVGRSRGVRGELRWSEAVEVRRPTPHSAKQNDHSLVTRISHQAGASILLPGDIEVAGEQWLVDEGLGRATVVKAPHHGSRTSSSAAFLDATDPAVALVSAGRHSRFGHPHPGVLGRYARRGVATYTSGEHGLVVVSVDARGRVEIRPTRVLPTR